MKYFIRILRVKSLRLGVSKFIPIFNISAKNKKEKDLQWRVSDTFIERINKDDAKFILEHAEKQLKEVNSISATIVARSTSIASIVAGGLIALIGYSINRWDSKGCWDALLICSAAGSVYLLVQCILLILNIMGRNYIEIGAEPQALLLESFYDIETPDDQRLINFYINEIESYQARIKANKTLNERRWKKFHLSLWMLVSTPVLIAVLYWLTTDHH